MSDDKKRSDAAIPEDFPAEPPVAGPFIRVILEIQTPAADAPTKSWKRSAAFLLPAGFPASFSDEQMAIAAAAGRTAGLVADLFVGHYMDESDTTEDEVTA